MDKKSEIDVKENKGRSIKNFTGTMQFENVFFNYPQRPDAKILQGLTLSIPAGKTVALCGSSGGGKSTVIQLLQRFYDPLSGVVKLDGNDIKQIDLDWLRQQMALVSQEPVLFALSIKENIRLGRLDATDEECIEAAKQANAHNFIMGLKDTYDTLVGEQGSQMSGGQKQRIAM
jgi:ATP-binding cassette subfamily B (MDR/TAP) protein 1